MNKFLSNVGLPVWFVLMGIGFMFFWPIGLIIFAFVAWSYANSNVAPIWQMSFWSSGNKAFDKYQEEERAKLDAEKEAFGKFIEAKLSAKDQAEFQEFKTAKK